ncbi:hypothetical protein MTO96_024179 [Rhipicephalus appendiculatus]
MAPIDYSPLPGDIALRRAVEAAGGPAERRPIRHHGPLGAEAAGRGPAAPSCRMSPDEVRRVTMAFGNLGQKIGVPVTATVATTSAEPSVDDDAGGSPGTGDDRTGSGEGHRDALDEGFTPAGTELGNPPTEDGRFVH